MEKKLLDESEEVQKLLESFCCKYPVTPDSESQPSSFKVKSRPEDEELDRRVACTFESEDIKKVPCDWEITATGKSLYYALTEQHEATHAMFKQSELAHGTRVKVNRGTEQQSTSTLWQGL